MAINRTNFNLLVDDDGSNLVGTIWDKAHIKDVILDPVDAALLTVVGNATAFTVTDTSGAGLGTLGVGRYIRLGQIVVIWAQPIYPSTSNGLGAKIGGLPFPNNPTLPSGFYVVYGPPLVWHLSLNSTDVLPLVPATMAVKTNAELSGSNNALVGVYFTTAP